MPQSLSVFCHFLSAGLRHRISIILMPVTANRIPMPVTAYRYVRPAFSSPSYIILAYICVVVRSA